MDSVVFVQYWNCYWMVFASFQYSAVICEAVLLCIVEVFYDTHLVLAGESFTGRNSKKVKGHCEETRVDEVAV